MHFSVRMRRFLLSFDTVDILFLVYPNWQEKNYLKSANVRFRILNSFYFEYKFE